MKVCIVTVYNSINSGSYWQARTLKIMLERLGAEVFFLKRPNTKKSSASKINKIKSIIKRFLKGGFIEGKLQYKSFKDFHKYQEGFKIIPNKKKYFSNIDLFILGSDTIWNIDSEFFAKNYEIFFGGIFKDKDVISYAASVANTSLEKIKKYKDIPQMLDDMKGISVRDEQTYNVVKKLSKNEIHIVCDPTLLLRREEYEKMEKRPKEKNYIFLYLFSKLTVEQERDIINFARKKNLTVVNGLNNHKFGDKIVINSPNNFLNHMLYADYVITDTFHGTVFSVNLNKEFVAINRNIKKVNNFLSITDLDKRLINDDRKISDIISEKIDYKVCNDKIENFRNKSVEFIKKYLN